MQSDTIVCIQDTLNIFLKDNSKEFIHIKFFKYLNNLICINSFELSDSKHMTTHNDNEHNAYI